MEIKNYLFKNFYNNQKESIAKKVLKRNKKDMCSKDCIFHKKQESTTSLFKQNNNQKNNIFVGNKTNSSHNININNSSNFNSIFQSQSSEKNHLTQKKIGRILNSNSRNFSQANKISLNNKKKIITSTSNTTATSLINNQINNYNKCITDRNLEDNKIKNINNNKNIGSGSQFLGKNRGGHNNKDKKETAGGVIHKKVYYIGKKEINNNIAKNILKNKIQHKESKYQINYIENNNMNENVLFKKKIKNFKNSNSKLNNNKLKNNMNLNLNENKNKQNKNALNIKKLNVSNLPINFLDGKLIQGITNLNSNNTNITESNQKKECNTDRANYNFINNINSQLKVKEIINEQYNNVNNNYIIANIINNIKLNNKKVKKKKISRNKSIKSSEKKEQIMNTNLTSLNLLLKNSGIKNYPSSLRIKTIDLSKINNNKTPSIDYNISFNKKPYFENKNNNRRLFDANNNIHINKRNFSHKRKNYCNLKIKKKGKNYKRLINVPLKLTKKNLFSKGKKLNLEMNFSNNIIGFDKLNLLTFNYIHSLNYNHKNDTNSLNNKRKLSQGNYSNRYRNIFQLYHQNRTSTNESKRDSNYNSNKTDSISNILKKNLILNNQKNSKKNSKHMNSLSNYETNNKEKDVNKYNNKDNKNTLCNSKAIINKLNENNKKIFNKKNQSNSPFDINCLLKKGNSKKNNNNNNINNNENNILSKSKSRNISRNYKNNLGFLNNESKTNISKYKTNKSKNQKSDKNTHNHYKVVNNSKKRLKNLSVAISNINNSIKNNLDTINKEKERVNQFSINNIFYTEKTNAKNIKIENSNENKLISIKTNNSRSSLNKNIQSIKSIISIKEKNKSQNKSDFSKKSRNITIPISSQTNKTVIKEDQINNIKNNDNNEEKEFSNPLLVREYLDEILYSLLKEESELISKKLINHNYLMNEENEISPEMRAMVVDWLLEVHQIFHFQEKCLFTTIQIIDKYLSKINISIDEFQLLALTALNISSKQEEVEYPILDNFITISKNTLTKKEMIYMENKILSVLDYEILSPTMLDFFQIYASVCNLNPVEISQGLYIMNIILIDINMIKYKNSLLAFAVLEIIAKENKIKELFEFLKKVNKKVIDINGNNNNVCQILIEEINKEFNSNDLANEIKYLFRTILKTHYHNAKNKFNNQIFYGVSSYTSI